MKYKDALNLCNNAIVPDHDEKDSPIIYEIYEMVKQYNLKPTCITSYFRHAFFGTDYDA